MFGAEITQAGFVSMGADDLVVTAIKQALSMLGQAREALIFAQCSTAVAKVRQAVKSTRVRFVPPSGACRSPIQAVIRSGVLTVSLL